MICKEYGWTYYEYDDQPEEFLQAISAKRNVEATLRNEQNDKLERDIKSNAKS
jgi:hypothetical protein